MDFVPTSEQLANLKRLGEKLNILIPDFSPFKTINELYPDMDYEFGASMLHSGKIVLPYLRRRTNDNSLVRYKSYHLSISIYKVESMPVASYMINFYRKVDVREYRHKNWTEDLEMHKVFVYGDTIDEAFAKFLPKFAINNCKDLSDKPCELANTYVGEKRFHSLG